MTAHPTPKQTIIQAYADAYPAPWLKVANHLELILSTPPTPEVRLLVRPPFAPRHVGEFGVIVGAQDPLGITAKGEDFTVASEELIELPVERIGDFIAEAIASHPGAVDIAKIPKWAAEATADALVRRARDLLQGQAG
jgi:hypothetical protein